MKILLVGKNGMLGQEFMKFLARSGCEVLALTSADLDISKEEEALKVAKEFKPDVILNCAAYTNVDLAETEKDQAFKVNDLGAYNLALAAKKTGSILIHFSTDYVFDGKKEEGYFEDDSPAPLNVYGASKLAGEEKIKSILKEYYIIRTAWLFGEAGKNFVKTMLKIAAEKEFLEVVNDQFGSPTYAKDLAQWVWENCIMGRNEFGVYHVTNFGQCSWFDFAKAIFEVAKVEVDLRPINSEGLMRPAERPKFSALKSRKTLKMRDFHQALEDFFIKDL